RARPEAISRLRPDRQITKERARNSGRANDKATVSSTGKTSHSARNQYRQFSQEDCRCLFRNSGSTAATHAITLAMTSRGPSFPVRKMAKTHRPRRLGRGIQLNGPAPVAITNIATGKIASPIQRQFLRVAAGIFAPSRNRKEKYCASTTSAAKK